MILVPRQSSTMVLRIRPYQSTAWLLCRARLVENQLLSSAGTVTSASFHHEITGSQYCSQERFRSPVVIRHYHCFHVIHSTSASSYCRMNRPIYGVYNCPICVVAAVLTVCLHCQRLFSSFLLRCVLLIIC